MTKPAGKSGKGRNQRKKPNKGNATMTNYFPTEKKPAQTANNSGKTTGINNNDASPVASNGSSRSNTSSGSNNSYLGAVTNTNSTAPKNLEEKFTGTLEKTTDDDENWTTVSNKSPPRTKDKRNRETTPARQAKTDTTAMKAARKVGSPMTDKDSSPKRPNNPNVATVTEEKPENPKPNSFPTVGKKAEDAPKETPNPVASPPKLGRNPQQSAAEAALEPETTPLLTVMRATERRYPKPLLPTPAATQANRIRHQHPRKTRPTMAKANPTTTVKERPTKRTETKTKIKTTRKEWNSRSNHKQSIRKPPLQGAT